MTLVYTPKTVKPGEKERSQMGFKLTESERDELKEIIAHTQDATILRRSQAVLWLSEGMSVIEVARR